MNMASIETHLQLFSSVFIPSPSAHFHIRFHAIVCLFSAAREKLKSGDFTHKAPQESRNNFRPRPPPPSATRRHNESHYAVYTDKNSCTHVPIIEMNIAENMRVKGLLGI